ncbi:MAG: hypothetical protein PF692_05105 [Kiritimatiellae bacterium]|jgi:hypothetical protein|nr:hypothetical protein [Kiritimatiellia bacterium]
MIKQITTFLSRIFIMALYIAVMSQSYAATNVLHVAVVTPSDDTILLAATDLAEVELSQKKDIVLLERDQMKRLLDEHKINLSGFVDAEDALKLGNILGVDCFVILQRSDVDNRVISLVAFHTETGVRLLHETFVDYNVELLSDTIIKSVTKMVYKTTSDQSKIFTVSVLPMQNAEFSSTENVLCSGVDMLVEQSLLKLPSVTLLERKQLNYLLRDKWMGFSAQSNSNEANLLLGSGRYIETELIRRADGKPGCAVTVWIKDRQRNEIGKQTCLSSSMKAQDVFESIWPFIEQEFGKGKEFIEESDPIVESCLLMQEASRLKKKDRPFAALRCAEAACAVYDSNLNRRTLADYQMKAALEILDSNDLSIRKLDLMLELFINGAKAKVDNSKKRAYYYEFRSLLSGNQRFAENDLGIFVHVEKLNRVLDDIVKTSDISQETLSMEKNSGRLVYSKTSPAKEFSNMKMLNPDLTFDQVAMQAVRSKRLDLLNYALDNGANINEPKLIYHAALSNFQVLKNLVERGADTKAKAYRDGVLNKICSDSFCFTNMGSWADLQYNVVIRYLLEHGADINCPDEYHSDTPLMEAIKHKRPFCTQTLMEFGADLSHKNYDGKTARDLAVEVSMPEIVEAIDKQVKQ